MLDSKQCKTWSSVSEVSQSTSARTELRQLTLKILRQTRETSSWIIQRLSTFRKSWQSTARSATLSNLPSVITAQSVSVVSLAWTITALGSTTVSVSTIRSSSSSSYCTCSLAQPMLSSWWCGRESHVWIRTAACSVQPQPSCWQQLPVSWPFSLACLFASCSLTRFSASWRTVRPLITSRRRIQTSKKSRSRSNPRSAQAGRISSRSLEVAHQGWAGYSRLTCPLYSMLSVSTIEQTSSAENWFYII